MRVFLGHDPREDFAYRVATFSARRMSSEPVDVRPIKLEELRRAGIYRRPTSTVDGRLWDGLSGAPMATEFAISRFFLNHLAAREGGWGAEGWVLFADSDTLFKRDLVDLFALADDRYAVMCVQHPNMDIPEGLKMDGQLQTAYARKNWSSVMLWNMSHVAHQRLNLTLLNKLPGRDLHRFCWLDDGELGALPPEWNWLEGYSPPMADPAIVHLTRGGPWFPQWGHVAYAQDWLAELGRIALSRKGAPL